MTKKNDTKNEEKKNPGASLPEDKPDNVNMAPPVEDAKAEASTLKRGIAMEQIDSPRYGVPGQASATRSAAGGGAYHPSGQVGRSPANPEVRGAGSDPMNKLDIRDELAWNDMGANQYRTLIEGSPAGFAPDAILGNYTYEDNLVFQFDNAGTRPGVKNSPYRRRIKTIGKDQLCFIAGQHDSASKAAMRFYPTRTFNADKSRVAVDVQHEYDADTAPERSNYLMRGMKVTIGYSNGAFRITGVEFDTTSLPCQSTPDDLDVRFDNARVFWDIADRDITETYFDLVNKAENLQANKYSPLPDGQPDAAQHLMLARDVANTDAAIAMIALRSAFETYALHRSLRSEYGAGDGARAQARYMLGERIAQNTELETGLWADNENMSSTNTGVDMGQAEAVGAHNSSFMRLSMPEYIQTYLDSPSKYNSGFGVWVTQPRGLRLLFEEAQRSFDDCGFAIDKDTYTIINKMLGWHDVDGRLAGVSRMGIIAPVDYNELYKHATSGDTVLENIDVDEYGRIHSKYVMVDYVLNGSYYNHTEIRSPLVDAILQVFKYRIMPKLTNHTQAYEYYVPFDFACDHYSFGHAIMMEALAYMHQFNHPARAVFERFEQQYGVNPIMSDQMQELKLADVLAGSSYKGIGADPVFPAGDEALRLFLYLPEVYQLALSTWDSGLEYPDALATVKFTDLAPISDSIDDPQTLLFPMLYRTECMGQWRRVKDMGPEKLLCTRDFPIHRYPIKALKYTRNDALASYDVDISETPFFGVQMPKVYHTENSSGSDLSLWLYDVLCAPRYAGRLCPAPMGMLDFVRVANTSMTSASMKCGTFMDLHLANNGDETSTYGWMAAVDGEHSDRIFDIYSQGGALTEKTIELRERDIENYTVSFVYMPAYERNTLGMLLSRYFVHFGSGCLSQSALSKLQHVYGVWVATNQQSQTTIDVRATIGDAAKDISIAAGASGDYSKAKYALIKVNGVTYSLDSDPVEGMPPYVGDTYDDITVTTTTSLIFGERWHIANGGAAAFTGQLQGKTHVAYLAYENDAMRMWTNDNVMEFIYSPFTGNVSESIKAKGGNYADIDYDLTMPMMFGLAGYQMLWYDRLNVANYATKQAVGGRVYDDAMLRKSNLFFE